jgi:putative flippase GtrA
VIRFFKYGSVAAGSAGTDWTFFVILNFLGASPMAAMICARLAGGLFSFILNRSWSFSAGRYGHLAVHGRRFLLLYAVSYALAVGLFYLLVDVGRFPPYGSKLAVDVTCFLFNFGVMNAYVFYPRAGISRLLQAAFNSRR